MNSFRFGESGLYPHKLDYRVEQLVDVLKIDDYRPNELSFPVIRYSLEEGLKFGDCRFQAIRMPVLKYLPGVVVIIGESSLSF